MLANPCLVLRQNHILQVSEEFHFQVTYYAQWLAAGKLKCKHTSSSPPMPPTVHRTGPVRGFKGKHASSLYSWGIYNTARVWLGLDKEQCLPGTKHFKSWRPAFQNLGLPQGHLPPSSLTQEHTPEAV